MKNRSSFLAYLVSAFILVGVTLSFPRYLEPYTEAPIAWDVSGYYLYLPAIFIYKDLKKLEFLPGVIEKYKPSTTADQAYDGKNGNKLMKYPAGLAVLYAPFFFLAHAIALVLDYPADGFSLPYQVSIQLGSVLVGLLGLWFLRKNLLRFFSDGVTAMNLACVALGTNFFNYSTFDAAMPHVYGFTLLALLVHFTIRWHEKPAWADSIAIGACIGLATLVRPTDLLFVLVPLLWATNGWRQKYRLMAQHPLKLLLAVAVMVAIGFIQLIYWKTVAGTWLEYSYRDQGFSFYRPHLADVLFSYRKGWFVYTPLMLFAVVGLVFLVNQHRRLFPVIFVFCVLNTWIISSWDVWWYGGSFGQRGFVQSYALLAVPLAAFMAWMTHRHWRRWVFAPMVLFCIGLNLFQTRQAHFGPLETEAMNKTFYWRIFGKTKNDPYDRLLLDTNERPPQSRKNLGLLFFTDFEQEQGDTSLLSRQFAHSGSFSVFVDTLTPVSHAVSVPVAATGIAPEKWLRVSAWFYTPQKEWSDWWMPQLVVSFEKNSQPVHERFIRPCRVLNNHEWREAWMEIEVPSNDFDTLRIFLRNPRNVAPQFMDDLRVEMFDKG